MIHEKLVEQSLKVVKDSHDSAVDPFTLISQFTGFDEDNVAYTFYKAKNAFDALKPIMDRCLGFDSTFTHTFSTEVYLHLNLWLYIPRDRYIELQGSEHGALVASVHEVYKLYDQEHSISTAPDFSEWSMFACRLVLGDDVFRHLLAISFGQQTYHKEELVAVFKECDAQNSTLPLYDHISGLMLDVCHGSLKTLYEIGLMRVADRKKYDDLNEGYQWDVVRRPDNQILFYIPTRSTYSIAGHIADLEVTRREFAGEFLFMSDNRKRDAMNIFRNNYMTEIMDHGRKVALARLRSGDDHIF